MKKAKKQLLGLFGLSFVATMTVVAANIPPQEALATSTMSDTFSVRVIGTVPDVSIRGIQNKVVFVNTNHAFNIDYENVATIKVRVTYINDKNVSSTRTILERTFTENKVGVLDYNISDIIEGPDAFGKYVIDVDTTSSDGVFDEDTISFFYQPAKEEAVVDDVTGKHYIELEHMNDVKEVIVNVYDKSGNIVATLPPVTVSSSTTRIEIPFESLNLPSGEYSLGISYLDEHGTEIHESQVSDIQFTAAEVPDAGVPDTGGLFQNLNISNEDYLISGLIVFFVFGIVALGIILRDKKNVKKNR